MEYKCYEPIFLSHAVFGLPASLLCHANESISWLRGVLETFCTDFAWHFLNSWLSYLNGRI